MPTPDDDINPSLFRILREDLATMRTEFNQRFDNIVSRDTFRDEKSRVDARFREQSEQIGALNTAIAQEATARVTAEANAMQRQISETNERVKVKRQTTWQWLALGITLVIGPVLGALIGAAMYAAGIGAGP